MAAIYRYGEERRQEKRRKHTVWPIPITIAIFHSSVVISCGVLIILALSPCTIKL